jgi:hypothetical protein
VTVSSINGRDEGLRRVSTITRWVAALGVAGTGFLAAVVYRAAPGHSTVSTSSAGATTAPGPPQPAADPNATVDPNATAPADPGFQAPTVAPVPVYQAPIVRSGAS